MNCKKCGGEVPKRIIIDGKRINCQRRKYCLTCSPFGHHNTRKLENISQRRLPCIQCGNLNNKQGRYCSTCYFNNRQKQVTAKVKQIVGDQCWICGYNKTWRNICFHHVDPSKKLMGLSSREYMLSWDKVLTEMKKCILVCHNCHGEIHEGLVSNDCVEQLYNERWTNVKKVKRDTVRTDIQIQGSRVH